MNGSIDKRTYLVGKILEGYAFSGIPPEDHHEDIAKDIVHLADCVLNEMARPLAQAMKQLFEKQQELMKNR